MQVLISFLNFLEHIPWFYRAQGYAFLRNIFFPAFQGSAGPFPLHCLTATRLRGPFQSGLGLYVKNSWKSDLGVTRRKICLKIHLRGASLISYSATPRVFRRICLGAEHIHRSKYVRCTRSVISMLFIA